MSSEELLYSVEGNVATIQFNRPKDLNSLLLDTYVQFAKLMNKADEDNNVLVTYITGSGRFFSSGANVKPIESTHGVKVGKDSLEKANENESPSEYLTRRFHATIVRMSESVAKHKKVVVVGLNGPVVGYSAAFISHADIIYASEKATLHALFTQLGLSPEGGSSYMFVKRMGIAKASEAILFSKKLSASDLLECGFVNKVFPDLTFQTDVKAEIKNLTKNLSPNSVLVAKKILKSYFIKDEVRNISEEVTSLVKRFESGEPQKIFAQLAVAHTKKSSKL
ncbi:hypothetical protein HDU92_002236 [Lobulomyces angularis]|nr:hypothetical protein HDU92_002236 [Lobulomyces angularis]